MKQVIQNYKTGELKVEEVDKPTIKYNSIIIKTKSSLISAGTERTKIETAHMNLLEKAISRLDLVKILLNNIKQEGVVFTFKKAFNKLNSPITLGYSASGEVVEIDEKVTDVKIGDKVVCIGEGTATHAEYNITPQNSFVKMPENISFEEGAFGGLGAIALNSVEVSQLKKGNKVVVIGLGLLGQIVAQILKARGIEVLGVEIDNDKLELAKNLGIKQVINPIKDDVLSSVQNWTENIGADGVIITAASKNNLPIEIAGKITRNKGVVILVGAMPIVIPREEFYKKELVFMISRGFGADIYFNENKYREYLFNYKPKSMKENLANFLQMISDGDVNVLALITHKFEIDDAKKAYDMIFKNTEKYLGVLFGYGCRDAQIGRLFEENVGERNSSPRVENNKVNIGFIGAGSFAQGYILPILKKRQDVCLRAIATASGVSAASVDKKFGFLYNTTDYNVILNDKNIGTIFIATRHNLHAKFVIEALNKGKNVFVEKPLCLTLDELEQIKEAYKNSGKILMVGFNRRFSPFVEQAKDFLKNRIGAIMLTYRVNAGFLPTEHWLHSSEGGGRFIGEGCHFVDLMNFLVGADVLDMKFTGKSDENFNLTIEYKDGSIANIQYSSVGDVSYSRERLEAFCDNSVVVVDNYKMGDYSRNGVVKKLRKFERDMGHTNEINYFIDGLKNNKSLIEFNDLVKVSEMMIKRGKL